MAPLNREQIVELYQDLQSVEKHLVAQLALTTESSRPVDLDQPIGRLSRMDAMQNQQMAKANHGASEERLERVRAAIAAFSDGSYAICAHCQGAIEYARLKAIPEATACLPCSARREDPGV